MPLQQDTMLGPYQIVTLIGEGGMGAVYRARDTRLGRDVAVKVLTNLAFSDRERLLRFEQEARATGMLNHPNLLTVYDVGRDEEGNSFLVTELLEGEPLRSRLDRGPLSPRKAVDAALQMAQGLAAAHEKGVVHRDLKPDNVFLTRDGRLKILDFGIAKLTSRAGADGPTFEMAATEPGMVMGTVGYMSPEQVRGESVDARSDIFSLGTIFFEMLTGTRAFKRDSAVETLSAILKEDPPDLTELLPTAPPPLERLLRRCLEKDRDHRFQSALDLSFNLETLASMSHTSTLSGVARPAVTQPAPGSPAPPMQRTAAVPVPTRTVARPAVKPARRVSPLLLALLYLVSVAGAAYGAWWWSRRNEQEIVEPQFRRLTFRRGEVRSARFSPDGETIVYTAAWDGRPSEVFVVSRRSTDARPLEIPDSEILSVSPDAELAILLRRDRVTNLGTLARVPLAGGVPREVANDILQADWAPDGQSLAIIRQQGGKTRVEYPIGTVRYDTAHFVRDVRVSPDGKRLAILEQLQGEWALAIIDNAAPVTIARGWARGATGIAWSRDGREVWVSGTNSAASPPALYAVDVENSTMRLVTRLTGSVRIFDLSARGETLLSNGTWRAALMWKQRGAAAASAAVNPA
ncbi:MAG TPA: protein kinase, partial [Thermoanaerobaculia bacterium]|nr:protein kinase [Thermoanaerobaculia bacterium]